MIGTLFFVFWGGPKIAHAQADNGVSVSARVVSTLPPVEQKPIVQFTGWAAPKVSLKIKRGETLLGGVTADNTGRFSLTIDSQPAGEQIFTLSATDMDQLVFEPLTFGLDLVAGTTIQVTGIFFGPTIRLNTTGVKIGEPVTVSGSTAANSMVTVIISTTPVTTKTTTADNNGRWAETINTYNLSTGSYTVTVKATVDNVSSADSRAVSFSINQTKPAVKIMPADINQDTKTNIIDFSILMYYWHQRNPINSRVDLNHDGYVDLVDFSIMLYQWTG